MQKGDWFTIIDLKDAYFHAKIFLIHRKYQEICILRSGIQVQGPSLWVLAGSSHIPQMKRR